MYLYMYAPRNEQGNLMFGPGHVQKKEDKLSEDEVMI